MRIQTYFMTVDVGQQSDGKDADRLLDMVADGWRIESACGLKTYIYYVLRREVT